MNNIHALKCRIGVPPSGTACRAEATCAIVWPDGEKTPACGDCSTRMKMQANDAHAKVRIEPLR